MFLSRNGLRLGDDLSPLIFSFVSDYAITMVQIKQGDLMLNDTYQLSVILMMLIYGGSVNSIKENAEALVVPRKKVEEEVNADKLSTKSCLQNRMQDKVTI